MSIPCEGSRGFSSSSESSTGSIPIAIAGSESVSRLMNRSCTGAKGTGRPAIDVYSTASMAAMFPDKRNSIALRILR